MKAPLLLTPFVGDFIAPDCLSTSYRGLFKDGAFLQQLYGPITNSSCLIAGTSLIDSGSLSEMTVGNDNGLVWMERIDVDESIVVPTFRDEFDTFLESLSWLESSPAVEGQISIQPSSVGYELLYRSHSAALLSIPSAHLYSIDSALPRFWKSSIIADEPVSFLPVPPSSREALADILNDLAFNPEISSIVNGLSIAQMKNDIAYLTGESTQSPIVSRHAFADGSRVAANWLLERLEESGAECELKPFLVGFSPNVICRYAATTNTTARFILGAHYDSRGSFGSVRAPGGDDDGSGSTSILAIGRAIKAKGIKFDTNVELALFSGEEQGLIGSRAYSRELRAINASVTLMIQADMLAFHAPDEPPQIGLPDIIGTPEATFLVGNISKIYSPELTVGYTPACCSDHQSFHEQGYPATQVFERAGPIIDPMYHNSGDLSRRDGYDFEQLKSIAKVQFATLLHGAGYSL